MAGYNYMNGGHYAMDRNKAGYGATPTERVVEHFHAPVVVTEYQYISQEAKVESMKNYGVTGDKWRRPLNPAHDRPQVAVTEIGYGSPIAEVEPVKNYGVTGGKWRGPLNPAHDRPQVAVTEIGYGSPIKEVNPVKDYGITGDKWRRLFNPVQDRPQVAVNDYGYGFPTKVEPMKDSVVTGLYRPPEVEEFITKVQTEASRPTRPSVLSATNWRNMPNGNIIREPTITSKEGWEERPSRDTPLSGPINDIGKAMEMLKEAIKPSPVTAAAPPQPRFVVPASTVLKREAYTEVIDSREAARRYGNFNQSSRPFQTGETHIGTINSKEAAQQYNGIIIGGPKRAGWGPRPPQNF